MLKKRFYIVFLIGLLVIPTLANAQGGTTQPQAPSVQGGSTGSPGMSGATGNTTTTRSTTSISGGSASVPTIATPDPSGGGRGDNGGSRPNGGSLPTLPSGTGEHPTFNFGSGSTNGENPFASFFGESGLSTRTTTTRTAEQSWAEFGGFGTLSQTTTVPTGSADGLSTSDWAIPTSNTLPVSEAPSFLTTDQAALDAQAATWQNGSQDTAQQTYDQLWTEYYDAVTSAAQTYATTVTSSEAYQAALAYSTVPTGYYAESAAEFAEYCYYYPWDCYSYVYDEASGQYVNVESTSDQPTGTVTIENITVNWSEIPTQPTSSAEAYEALVVFANDQLGTPVQPLYAGDATTEIQAVIQYLPDDVEAYAALLSSVDPSYWGIFNGGVGVVGILDCSSGCSTQNLSTELSDSSVGVYGLTVASAMPTDDTSALNLITSVYPKLNGLEFAAVTDVETGYAYMATALGIGVDSTGRTVSTPKLIYAGVVDVGGKPMVYALVAVGQVSIDSYHSLMQ